jgi:hypothetical protein
MSPIASIHNSSFRSGAMLLERVASRAKRRKFSRLHPRDHTSGQGRTILPLRRTHLHCRSHLLPLIVYLPSTIYQYTRRLLHTRSAFLNQSLATTFHSLFRLFARSLNLRGMPPSKEDMWMQWQSFRSQCLLDRIPPLGRAHRRTWQDRVAPPATNRSFDHSQNLRITHLLI